MHWQESSHTGTACPILFNEQKQCVFLSLLLWPDKYKPSEHRYSASTMSEPQNGLQESHHRERAPRHAKIRYQLSPWICPTDLRNSAMQQHALTRKQPHCVSNTVHWPKTMCVLFCICLLLWPDKYKPAETKHRYPASTVSEPQSLLQESHHRERTPRGAFETSHPSPLDVECHTAQIAAQDYWIVRKVTL